MSDLEILALGLQADFLIGWLWFRHRLRVLDYVESSVLNDQEIAGDVRKRALIMGRFEEAMTKAARDVCGILFLACWGVVLFDFKGALW